MDGMRQPSSRRKRLRKHEPLQGKSSTLDLEEPAVVEITDPDDTGVRPAVKSADSQDIPSATLSAFSQQSVASRIELPLTPIPPSQPDWQLSEETEPDDQDIPSATLSAFSQQSVASRIELPLTPIPPSLPDWPLDEPIQGDSSPLDPGEPAIVEIPEPDDTAERLVVKSADSQDIPSATLSALSLQGVASKIELPLTPIPLSIPDVPLKHQNLSIPGTRTRPRVYLSRTLLAVTCVVTMLLLRSASVSGQSASLLTPAHTPFTAARATSTPAITASSLGDWPTYMGDDGHSGFNAAENIITKASAPTLKLQWTQSAGDAVVTQPIVSHGLIYWASWDGFEYATDLSGKTVWATNLGTTTPRPICVPPHLGVSSSATIANVEINGAATLVDFLGGGNGNFYALNARTGAVIWKTFLGTPPAHYLWSSPTLYNGSIYMGVASVGDCPLVQGQLVQMDAATGRIQHTFNTVPDGCVGGGVWSSPTIDEAAGTVYVSTGTIDPCQPHERYAIGLVELRAADLSFIQSWQVPKSERIQDGDFGATPTLFTTSAGTPMVGLVNKNGIYYAFKRGDLSRQVWETRIAATGINISSSAWDGQRLYVGSRRVTISGVTCRDGMTALNPDDGAIIWQHCLANTRYTGAVMVVPGLVAIGQGPYVTLLDATSGQILANVKNEDGAAFWGWATISHGVLYIGDTKGRLYAFAPEVVRPSFQ